MYKSIIIFTLSFACFSSSHAVTLLPLSTWIKDKNFTTLSIEDAILLTQRCSVAYSININFFTQFTSYDPKNLKDTLDKYLSVMSNFAILKITDKEKNKIKIEKYLKSLVTEQDEIFDSYLEIMQSNQPIPHSLYSELLATDLGVCDKFKPTIFEAYEQMKKIDKKNKN
jgi:hypothetical protein